MLSLFSIIKYGRDIFPYHNQMLAVTQSGEPLTRF